MIRGALMHLQQLDYEGVPFICHHCHNYRDILKDSQTPFIHRVWEEREGGKGKEREAIKDGSLQPPLSNNHVFEFSLDDLKVEVEYEGT